MIYYQNWSKNSFEYKYLKQIKKNIKENPNINCYIGFDFGFFCGCNIYYFQENKLANDIYKAFKDNNLKVRLFTNIDYNFDVIILHITNWKLFEIK
jgi:hypothetical protein